MESYSFIRDSLMSGFSVIPALDLRMGKCVRLSRGRDESAVEYSADPVSTAMEWTRQGAERLHIVNLDGAFGRDSGHLKLLERIRANVDALLEYGGGLRTIEEMEAAANAGADRLVLGTVALEQPDVLAEALSRFGGDRLIVALDAVNGMVATRGWTVITDRDVVETARALADQGVPEILATDVGRDGMLSGLDLRMLGRLADAGVRVLASGGFSSEDDLRALLALRRPAIVGVIVGKALYERRVSLPGLLAIAREGAPDAS